MKNRAPIDFLLILIVYLACAGLIYGAVTMDWPTDDLGVKLGTDPHTHQQYRVAEDFEGDYGTWCAVTGGVSLLCAFAWYISGRMGSASQQALFRDLDLHLAGLADGDDRGRDCRGHPADPEAEAIDNSWILTLSYMLWGPGFFFIATVLFSPVNTKFIVPGSSVVRRGW